MDTYVKSFLTSIVSNSLTEEYPGAVPDTLPPGDQELVSQAMARIGKQSRDLTRLTRLLNGGPHPVLILNESHEISDANPSFLKMSGYSRDDLTGKSLPAIIPDLPDYFMTTRDVPEIRTTPVSFPAGTRYLEGYPIPVSAEGEYGEETILVFKDITLRVIAEQEAARIKEKLEHDYGERVKEQRLFYSTASLIQDDTIAVEDVLGRIAEMIPPGWQYPDVCAARIQYSGHSRSSPAFRETQWIQKGIFTTRTGKRGSIEVVYLEEKPPEQEGPFLLEERNLINSLSELIRIYLDRKENEQELDDKMHALGERVKEQRLFYSTASLIQDDMLEVGDVLSRVVNLIPPGWQYPECCEAAITYAGMSAKTPGYRDSCWKQTASFTSRHGGQGSIEVVYCTEQKAEYEGPFLLEERNLINSLAEMLKTYIDRKENEQELAVKMHDLGERVKEQRLFYSTASLIQDDTLQTGDVLSRVANLIPPGWQYPECCAARVIHGDTQFRSDGYRDTPWIQSAAFTTRFGISSRVDVVYLEEKPPEQEGPFLTEERNLINSLAEMLKTYLDRKEGEEELEKNLIKIRKLEHLNNSIVQQIPMPILLIDQDQNILVTNDAYLTLTGYSHDQLLSMRPTDIPVMEYSGSGLKELLADQRPTFGELTLDFPAGIRILEQHGIPVFSISGDLENYLIVYNDITARKEKEQEVEHLLSESRQKAALLSQSAAGFENCMAQVAQGDLTNRSEMIPGDPLNQIKKDCNTALDAVSSLIEELENSINRLSAVTGTTLEQTGAIAGSVQNVISRVHASTTGARGQLEEIIRISDEISTLWRSVGEIRQIVDRLMEEARSASLQGEQARELGNDANRKMESVGAISSASMDQITDLSRQMNEIDKIVRMIADISSQTNLLALNAAIEAARAGEHGKGFAVVAQEVKNLAGQSKVATTQIEELIRGIQKSTMMTVDSIQSSYNEVGGAIESVHQAIEALSVIISKVHIVREGMEQISQATESEEVLMNHLLDGVGSVNRQSEKNLHLMEEVSMDMDLVGRSAQEIAASTHEISDLTSRLKQQSGNFTL